MQTFKDDKNREWKISLTIGDAKRVLDLVKVNLLAPESGEPPVLTRLGTDEILLVDTVFALIKPQADAAGVSDVDFGGSLGGTAALAMQTAFYAELIDFFQKRGRTDRSKATAKQLEMITAAVERIGLKLDAMNSKTELDKIFGSSSTNSQV